MKCSSLLEKGQLLFGKKHLHITVCGAVSVLALPTINSVGLFPVIRGLGGKSVALPFLANKLLVCCLLCVLAQHLQIHTLGTQWVYSLFLKQQEFVNMREHNFTLCAQLIMGLHFRVASKC